VIWNESATERNRHRRAIAYVCISFALAVFGCLYLGFDRSQTMAYGVLAYVILNALNYRAMFAPAAQPQDKGGGEH